ncbi:MAG: hypothetical protein RL160_977, partial [Bacteroidota bacterium]
ALTRLQGYQLHLSNGMQVPVSEQAKARVMEWIKTIALGA